MKVITLNCFLSPWCPRKNRLPQIIKELSGEKPDIVLLQEVYFESDAKYIANGLRRHGFVDSFRSKSLLIVSKIPFTSRSFYDFAPHFNLNFLIYINEICNWIYGKGFQIVEIDFRGHPVVVVNTHLLSAYGLDYGSFRKARLRQLVEICDYLKQAGVKRIILGGDFNFDLNSPSYQTVTNHYEFHDPLHNVEGNTISTENLNRQFFHMAKMNQRLDHFFIKGFAPNTISEQIVFREPYEIANRKFHVSDHYGLALNV